MFPTPRASSLRMTDSAKRHFWVNNGGTAITLLFARELLYFSNRFSISLIGGDVLTIQIAYHGLLRTLLKEDIPRRLLNTHLASLALRCFTHTSEN